MLSWNRQTYIDIPLICMQFDGLQKKYIKKQNTKLVKYREEADSKVNTV